MLLSDRQETYTYSPLNSFTTVDLRRERGNNLNIVSRFENPASREFLKLFDTIWNDEEQLKDVTEDVIDMISVVYQEKFAGIDLLYDLI